MYRGVLDLRCAGCFYYLSFAQSNGNVLRGDEGLERHEYATGLAMRLFPHNPSNVTGSIWLDQPIDVKDVPHQPLRPGYTPRRTTRGPGAGKGGA